MNHDSPDDRYRIGPPIPPTGRLFGIDPGTVRVGLAVCDSDRIVSSPYDTLTVKDPSTDAAALKQLFKREAIVGLVLGLPIHLSGQEGTKAEESRTFGAWLHEISGLPLEFVDERFTSALAEDALNQAKVRWKDRKGKRDRIAAQVILHTYLEMTAPKQTPLTPDCHPEEPDSDESIGLDALS